MGGDSDWAHPPLGRKKKKGKVPTPTVDDISDTESLPNMSNKALLSKMDKLRELSAGALIPLPQLLVVGDQSSGKSSLLESLSGFSFPRSAGLTTRYATQLSIRRDPQESVVISIIPRPNASDATKERLRGFRRSVPRIKGAEIATIIEEASVVMGIRPALESMSDPVAECSAPTATFSQDVLKIEISRPDGDNLTMIDVPGIFRASTPGLTTDEDIRIIDKMVKEYMRNKRTIIIAVIPSNVDIATQEILKLAKEADPAGTRTLGVLTKPDLATEQATRQAVFDLVHGRRNDLHLGYYVVKNRGADDSSSSLEERSEAERRFFSTAPWNKINAPGRVGIDALRDRLSELLMTLTKKEFPAVKKDIADRCDRKQKRLDRMGVCRDTEAAQRSYLGAISERFQKITDLGLSAYYNGDDIFEEMPEMKLITRVLDCNEAFAYSMWTVGHTMEFETTGDNDSRYTPPNVERLDYEQELDCHPEIKAELGNILAEDHDRSRFNMLGISGYIQQVYQGSRGPELGTFNSSIIPIAFKEQSVHWRSILLGHMSAVIFIVHQFVRGLLENVCPDEQVRAELWDNFLLEKMRDAYKSATDHAIHLLEIERDGVPITYNQNFNKSLQRARKARLEKSVDSLTVQDGKGYTVDTSNPLVPVKQFLKLSKTKADTTYNCEDIHDILKSYYEVARSRFVDVVCQQVVSHDLLHGPQSPLRIFTQDLIHRMKAEELEMVAGEGAANKTKRERLNSDIKSLTEAMRLLRA